MPLAQNGGPPGRSPAGVGKGPPEGPPGILLRDQDSKGVLGTARHLSKCPFRAGAFHVDDFQNAANLPRCSEDSVQRAEVLLRNSTFRHQPEAPTWPEAFSSRKVLVSKQEAP